MFIMCRCPIGLTLLDLISVIGQTLKLYVGAVVKGWQLQRRVKQLDRVRFDEQAILMYSFPLWFTTFKTMDTALMLNCVISFALLIAEIYQILCSNGDLCTSTLRDDFRSVTWLLLIIETKYLKYKMYSMEPIHSFVHLSPVTANRSHNRSDVSANWSRSPPDS